MTSQDKRTHRFEAEVTQVLSLVINSLYSNKEIFLRELISNAADALDKLRFRAIGQPELLGDGYQARVRLVPDEEGKTLTVWDNGVGMSADEMAEHLGTVAKSGSRAFLESLAESDKKDVNLIGQFGVGFYSAYLVADRVEVVSRAAGQETAHRWSSDGKESFTIEPAERDAVGTSVILHLKEDQREYLSEWSLRELVRRYSDFLSYTVELQAKRSEGGEEKLEWVAINEASALWQRRPEDITDEQYNELYRHLTRDWQPAIARSHFSVEGTQMFTGLLFLPEQPPLDLFSPESRHGVRLYVKRVFIMDDCEELLPRWLRFVRGLIDSEDLPLNISRELLQDSAIVRTIRKQVVRRVLAELEKLAKEKPGVYATFWRNFGAVMKEGLHFEPENKDRLAPLLRFETTAEPGALVSLPQYVARMKEGQKDIFYAMGASRDMLANSPHLEGLKQRGYEVLLLTDGIDQWALEGLRDFDGKSMVNAMDAELDLDKLDLDKAEKDQAEGDKSDDKSEADKSEADKAQADKAEADKPKGAGELQPLLDRVSKVLDGKVSEVRLSKRLTASPVCLVIPKGGLPSHIERALRAMQRELPETKRILELNPEHALIRNLKTMLEREPTSPQLDEWIELLHEQALLTEGSPLNDPSRFAGRMTSLMERASRME